MQDAALGMTAFLGEVELVEPVAVGALVEVDTEFDQLWLRSMITHHQGAVAMAQSEIARGENPTAVKMAKVIIDWQQLEIGRMHAMLGPAE